MRATGRQKETAAHDTSKGIARGLGAVDEAYVRAQGVEKKRQDSRKDEREKNQLVKEAAESYMRMVCSSPAVLHGLISLREERE